MNKLTIRILFLTLTCLFAAISIVSAKASVEEQRQEIRELSKSTLTKLYDKYPSAKSIIEGCYGYATLSNSDFKVPNLIIQSANLAL